MDEYSDYLNDILDNIDNLDINLSDLKRIISENINKETSDNNLNDIDTISVQQTKNMLENINKDDIKTDEIDDNVFDLSNIESLLYDIKSNTTDEIPIVDYSGILDTIYDAIKNINTIPDNDTINPAVSNSNSNLNDNVIGDTQINSPIIADNIATPEARFNDVISDLKTNFDVPDINIDFSLDAESIRTQIETVVSDLSNLNIPIELEYIYPDVSKIEPISMPIEFEYDYDQINIPNITVPLEFEYKLDNIKNQLMNIRFDSNIEDIKAELDSLKDYDINLNYDLNADIEKIKDQIIDTVPVNQTDNNYTISETNTITSPNTLINESYSTSDEKSNYNILSDSSEKIENNNNEKIEYTKDNNSSILEYIKEIETTKVTDNSEITELLKSNNKLLESLLNKKQDVVTENNKVETTEKIMEISTNSNTVTENSTDNEILSNILIAINQLNNSMTKSSFKTDISFV